ncbi:MAG: YjfB family protein [Lachnospiraceae bacterium]|nr:YjfB family protein [Lachnospiraceae bacterium]
MDVAGLSMALSQVSTMNDIGVAVLSKQLDMNESLGQSMVAMMDRSMMEQSITPHIGSNFDMSI